MSEIKTVDFYGQEIQTVEHDGRKWVSVREVCEGIGIDRKTQERKIKGDPKFSWGHMTLPSSDGKKYKKVVVSLDSLDTWLLTLNASKVREDLRANVVKYQEECSQVLYNYWNNGIAINPRIADPKWQAERDKGKVIRNDETDVIQQFIDYAYGQGSENAQYYYRHITRATYKGLELIDKYWDECRNLRENLSTEDIIRISHAEILVQRVLAAGMAKNVPYKDIFKTARDRVAALNIFMKEELF